jgi:putative tryptophan/tyrosine transport system substrate-binding protein
MQFDQLKRREFVTLLGVAVAWPLAARAQQPERVRRIGVLTTMASDDALGQARLMAFGQGLAQLGWTVGRNVQIDIRWTAGKADDARKYATELVALAPDVILAAGGGGVGPLLQVTGTVPIVFTQVTDPVGAGFVESLGRPGGNATGFINFEYGMSVKWLELLKQIAPSVRRVAVLRDPAIVGGVAQLGAIQGAAPSFGVEVSPVGVRDGGEIKRALAAFARGSNDGLIVLTTGLTLVHRELIISLAARHRLPAVYTDRTFVTGGGLISYGPDRMEHFRLAAGYVDRILKGDKPAELPVQAPTKYELVINLKTAKALGLSFPPGLLAIADEVIE